MPLLYNSQLQTLLLSGLVSSLSLLDKCLAMVLFNQEEGGTIIS